MPFFVLSDADHCLPSLFLTLAATASRVVGADLEESNGSTGGVDRITLLLLYYYAQDKKGREIVSALHSRSLSPCLPLLLLLAF